MIVSAAVKIQDLRQNKEIIIPCHRHCNAFQILHDFGYKISEFKTLAQGFLDEENNFYDRIAAKRHAIECHQIESSEYTELFSEDLW